MRRLISDVIVRPAEPLCTIALWDSPFAAGIASSVDTLPPPPLCPNIVTFDASPPNSSIFLFTHCSAATMSSIPALAELAYASP